MHSTSAESTPDDADAPAAAGHTVWTDQSGQSWRLRTSPEELVFESDSRTLNIPSSAWSRDIYIARHGDSYIVRVDTQEANVAFVVPEATAAPLIDCLEGAVRRNEPTESNEVVDDAANVPLMWPKVSPLAVWALICSSLVFLPVVGWLPAFVTIVLLLIHRKRVRRARAWDHSRGVCKVACAFLVGGAVVSIVATLGMIRAAPEGDDLQDLRMPVFQDDSPSEASVLPFTVAQGRLEALEKINWGMVAAGLFVVVLSLSVHEAAHALTAWWLGDDLARQMGRVTLNPASHIDPIGTIVLPVLLYIAGAGVFGWAKPVPVRVEGLVRRRRAHILISSAGPGSNLLLAAASFALLLGLGSLVTLLAPGAVVSNYSTTLFSDPVSASGFPLASIFAGTCTVLKLSFLINVLLAVFNMIPIPPLDGSWVLEHLFPRTFGPLYARIRPFGFLLFLFLIYYGQGVLLYLFLPVRLVFTFGIALLQVSTAFS